MDNANINKGNEVEKEMMNYHLTNKVDDDLEHCYLQIAKDKDDSSSTDQLQLLSNNYITQLFSFPTSN